MKNTYIFIVFSLIFFILPGILLLINKKKSTIKNHALMQNLQRVFIVLNVPAFFVISFVIFFSPFIILGPSSGSGTHIGLLFATVAAFIISGFFILTSWSEKSSNWLHNTFPKLTKLYNSLVNYRFTGLISSKHS